MILYIISIARFVFDFNMIKQKLIMRKSFHPYSNLGIQILSALFDHSIHLHNHLSDQLQIWKWYTSHCPKKKLLTLINCTSQYHKQNYKLTHNNVQSTTKKEKKKHNNTHTNNVKTYVKGNIYIQKNKNDD